MIEPSPTTKIDPTLARGVLGAVVAATATKPAYIVLAVPNTSYQLHLRSDHAPAAPVGKRIIGRVSAQARRVDGVGSGGKYVEPVAGRPRRVQGTVLSANSAAGTITVDAGVPIECKLTDARQRPEHFAPGTMVSFDVLDGAAFSEAR